jgi:hypothetical protein
VKIETVATDRTSGAVDPARPVDGVTPELAAQPLVAERSKTVAGKKKVIK